MAGIYVPERGSVQINDIVLSDYSYTDRQDFRLIRMGLVFQEFELLDYLSLVDNVTLPYRTSPILSYTDNIRQEARELISAVGLANKEKRKPAQLSQGERQRVAICRALITSPEILLCDEPTGALDLKTGVVVLEAIERVNRELGTTTVVITHNVDIAQMADRVVRLSDGTIVGVEVQQKSVGDNILQFEHFFPGAKVVALEENYRSTAPILAASGGLIAANVGRRGKKLFTSRPGGERLLAVAVENVRACLAGTPQNVVRP